MNPSVFVFYANDMMHNNSNASNLCVKKKIDSDQNSTPEYIALNKA